MLHPEMRDLPIRKHRRPPKRQFASGSSWSTRIIRVLSNGMIEDPPMAVGADMPSAWCARHPSPKKAPGAQPDDGEPPQGGQY
jgi:hypothetical protein